jgi:branched-chain amino acid transport system ATP-binding protein
MTAAVPDGGGTAAPPPEALLEVRGLQGGYGGIDVLHGVDLRVPAGTVVALLGPNGAGKTTTLRIIAGQLEATGGDVVIAGRRVNGASPDELARCGLCLIPEGRGVFPNLTVRPLMMSFGGRSRRIEAVAYERFRA